MIAPTIESESEYIKSWVGLSGRAHEKLKGGKQVFALIIALNSFVHSRKTFPCCPGARPPTLFLVVVLEDRLRSRGRRFLFLSKPTIVCGELDSLRKTLGQTNEIEGVWQAR